MSVEDANEKLATGPNRGPWVVHFDDLKRKLAPKGIILNKLMTCIPGTDDYNAYMAAFTDPANDTIEVCVEDDGRSTTFYTITYPKITTGATND